MSKPKKDKLGYLHEDYQIKETNDILKNSRNGDVVYYDRHTNTSGEGGTFIVYNGKEWQPHYCSCKHRTLQQIVDEGFNLKYAGRRGDDNKQAWWNECDKLDLFDLAILNS